MLKYAKKTDVRVVRTKVFIHIYFCVNFLKLIPDYVFLVGHPDTYKVFPISENSNIAAIHMRFCDK